jgi:hypothetical protein
LPGAAVTGGQSAIAGQRQTVHAQCTGEPEKCRVETRARQEARSKRADTDNKRPAIDDFGHNASHVAVANSPPGIVLQTA